MIQYTIDDGTNLVRVRMSGTNTYEDLEHHFANVYQDRLYRASLNTIFVVDEEAGGPLLAELPKAKSLLELAAQAPDAQRKWAVVITSTFQRNIVEFLMKDVRLKPLEMRFFSDEPSALAWLNAK